MKKIIHTTFLFLGFRDYNDFLDSLFHNTKGILATSSVILATLAYYFEQFVGIESVVGVVMLGLFAVEMWSGIKASKKEGKPFESNKFQRGWVKLFVYMLMIGFAHVLANNVKIKPIFGVEFNYYEWLHYAFFNFVLINFFISNIENFIRLGWDEFMPILKKAKSWLNIKLPTDEKKD